MTTPNDFFLYEISNTLKKRNHKETMRRFSKLFPGADQCWTCVDLDEAYTRSPLFRHGIGLRDPNDQNALLDEISLNNRLSTYGGFGEDRSRLWAGFEPDHELMIHVGVDFNNLQPGQVVSSLTEGRVVHVLNDSAPFNGWGQRVMIQTGDLFFLYGHLNGQAGRQVKVNDRVLPGTEIGHLGDASQNGGWFTHLHLQVMHQSYVNTTPFDAIDGYVFTRDLTQTAGILNPLAFV